MLDKLIKPAMSTFAMCYLTTDRQDVFASPYCMQF